MYNKTYAKAYKIEKYIWIGINTFQALLKFKHSTKTSYRNIYSTIKRKKKTSISRFASGMGTMLARGNAVTSCINIVDRWMALLKSEVGTSCFFLILNTEYISSELIHANTYIMYRVRHKSLPRTYLWPGYVNKY